MIGRPPVPLDLPSPEAHHHHGGHLGVSVRFVDIVVIHVILEKA